MIDTEVKVINLLETTLNELVDDRIFRLTVPDAYADKYPYIRVSEINNINDDYRDNKAKASDIRVQIDFWTKGDPAPIQNLINKTMESHQFKRTGVTPFYEEDTGAFRKAMRYISKANLKEET